MSLSVVSRPKGFIVNPTTSTGVYTNNSSVITKVAHGLNIGDTIYIYANQAIGYWYVTPITVDTFNIREYGGATVYTFIGFGSFSYSKNVDAGHGWNAVHLPIVYKLSSNAWPVNSVDTARTVSSFANDYGYMKLTCSGTLKSDLAELEWVKITGAGLDGIYKILTWYSNSVVTINLAYDPGISFTGATVQYYYNNYRSKIRIYAGLSSSHYFGSLKTYALINEQEIVPDSSGVVMINISEFLKKRIEILKNDLLKGTLQNNLDAFCQFYITYAEAYDYSAGGYSILDFVSSYTDDSTSFTGYGVNSELPFKNLSSGYMTDYVYGSQATKLKFLTPSVYPELNVGKFFDISFINQIGARLRMKREAYKNGVVQNLFFDDINDYGVGIYRYELSQSVYLEDRIDLTLQWQDYTGYIDISEVKTIAVNNECYINAINLSWLNYLGGFDHKTFKTNSDLGADIKSTTESNKNIFPEWPKSGGAGADTLRFETSRESVQTIVVHGENLTADQVSDLFRIRLSPLVQIVNSRTDRRTVTVDKDSFDYLPQSGKLFDLTFKITYTDNFASQSL